MMQQSVEIENIEAMRREHGIDDVELRQQIRLLAIGDFVKLTFLTRARSCPAETWLVRVTRVRDGTFRGKLVKGPTPQSSLQAGTPVGFYTRHIHSIAKACSPRVS